MWGFGRKKPLLLGIDISAAAVKLLELSKKDNGYQVESYGVVPLPRNTVVDNTIAEPDNVSAAVRAVVKQSGTPLRHAVVAVPGSVVIAKRITMPAGLEGDELEAQIELEADQYIPHAREEVSLDFEVLGKTPKNPDLVDVLLVATRRENVEDRVSVLENAGLSVEIVEVESYAIEHAFDLIKGQLPPAVRDRAVAVADVGAMATTLNVIHGGSIIYTREQGFGGMQLTDEIQRRYGLTYEEAGLAKKEGSLPGNYAEEVLEPFKHALVQQISRSFQFYLSSTAQRGFDAVVLAGGCAMIPEIDRYVEAALQVPTVVANPFRDMSFSGRVRLERLNYDSSALMLACGLALRSFD
ncbi:MAG: pilus assembly protein PilM [Pseudomonadota bacterium]|jgi:type IV pilus assembly protein PilM